MGGKGAIKKLIKIDPEVKAIVSSSYSDDPILSNFQDYGFKGMMPHFWCIPGMSEKSGMA